MITYFDCDVLTAAQKRIEYVFDNFERIYFSVSSGKDSTVMYHLGLAEAKRRGRQINLFFLDQEAEYQGSIDLIREMMSHPLVIPHWFQVPIYMTNATSYSVPMLYAWEPGKEWMRQKEDFAITSINGEYPKRFYEFFDWLERQQEEPTAWLVGLRSKESLNRFRAISKVAGYKGAMWSTIGKSKRSFRFYPIYDWSFGDIWKYIADNGVRYNPVYDRMYALKGKRLNDIRISNLIHEKSFSCLAELQEVEPDTYDRLCRRLAGVHSAAIYAREGMIYNADVLPAGFTNWKAYRDSLLDSAPISEKRRATLKRRFDKQPDASEVHRQQARQVLLGDDENNVPVNTKARGKSDIREKWWDLL